MCAGLGVDIAGQAIEHRLAVALSSHDLRITEDAQMMRQQALLDLEEGHQLAHYGACVVRQELESGHAGLDGASVMAGLLWHDLTICLRYPPR